MGLEPCDDSIEQSLGPSPQDSLPGHGHHRPCADPDLGDDASGHRGLDDVVAAVILAGDAVQTFHVDGVWNAGRWFQFGASGNAAGHGSHFR